MSGGLSLNFCGRQTIRTPIRVATGVNDRGQGLLFFIAGNE